jgi:hypothetical protein
MRPRLLPALRVRRSLRVGLQQPLPPHACAWCGPSRLTKRFARGTALSSTLRNGKQNGKTGKETGKRKQEQANAETTYIRTLRTLRRYDDARGGKRSTSFKPGQSGNPIGSSRKQCELRRQRRNTEKAFVDAVAIQLEITAAAAAELCRRGLVAPGHERDPQAVATGVLEAAARYLGLKEVPDPGIPIIPRG